MKATVAGTAVLATLASWPATAQQAEMREDRPRITVTGEAVVHVKPDEIVISLGIETWDADINVAKRRNHEILQRTFAAAKECGVLEKDVQTDQLSIQPRWEDGYKRESFIGYFARTTVVVTLSDAEKVERLVTGALVAGVNYIHGIDFQTTEYKKHREQARELALQAAREKAGRMARVLGQTVGPPIEINEDHGGSSWRYWSSWHGWDWGWGRSPGMSQVQLQADRGGSGEIHDTIALGKLAIRASVSVTFELRQPAGALAP